MAHSTGKKAALGANAPPIALTNHGERPNRMMNPPLRLTAHPDPVFTTSSPPEARGECATRGECAASGPVRVHGARRGRFPGASAAVASGPRDVSHEQLSTCPVNGFLTAPQ